MRKRIPHHHHHPAPESALIAAEWRRMLGPGLQIAISNDRVLQAWPHRH